MHADFWTRLSTDLKNGTFWADKIRELRDEPAQRLAVALQNLPLPAAFGEAAKALRSIIRSLRSSSLPFEEPLRMLYCMAAAESFVSASPFIDELLEPAQNAVEMLTETDWGSLVFDYATLGYSRLPLLNKTDGKWFSENWGEPVNHATLRDLHPLVWDNAVQALIAKRVVEHNQRWREFGVTITREQYLAIKQGVRDQLMKV